VQERSITAPDVYTSFVLPGILDFVRRPPKKTILDFGPALGENIARMEGCKLFIASFFDALVEDGRTRDPKTFAAECERILNYPDDVRFDLILVWDAFNYLSLAEVEVLARRLSHFSTAGTRMMALVSIQKKIPERPFRFVIKDRDSLRYETQSPGLRDCPRHNESDLLKRLAGFKVERGMLLRNGIREYSLVRNEAAATSAGKAAGDPRAQLDAWGRVVPPPAPGSTRKNAMR
jgi:hypothetical protein